MGVISEARNYHCDLITFYSNFYSSQWLFKNNSPRLGFSNGRIGTLDYFSMATHFKNKNHKQSKVHFQPVSKKLLYLDCTVPCLELRALPLSSAHFRVSSGFGISLAPDCLGQPDAKRLRVEGTFVPVARILERTAPRHGR